MTGPKASLTKKIEEYKTLMMDISNLFLQYLLLKKQSGEYTDDFLTRLYPVYLDFKFSRYKLVYGMKTGTRIRKEDIWEYAQAEIKKNKKEIELDNLETQVFSKRIDVSTRRWDETFKEIK